MFWFVSGGKKRGRGRGRGRGCASLRSLVRPGRVAGGHSFGRVARTRFGLKESERGPGAGLSFRGRMAASLEQVKKMKVAELKEELQKRNLPVERKKNELVQRLEEAINAQTQNQDQTPNQTTPTSAQTTKPATPAETKTDQTETTKNTDAPANPQDQQPPANDFEAAKAARAARFGIPLVPAQKSGGDKIKARQERFGVVGKDKDKKADKRKKGFDMPVDPEEEERRRKRAERFGLASS